jgi:hypothetical protein
MIMQKHTFELRCEAKPTMEQNNADFDQSLHVFAAGQYYSLTYDDTRDLAANIAAAMMKTSFGELDAGMLECDPAYHQIYQAVLEKLLK